MCCASYLFKSALLGKHTIFEKSTKTKSILLLSLTKVYSMVAPIRLLSFSLILVILLSGCMSSSKHLETAINYEQAHKPQLAFDHYLSVLQRKSTNEQAQAGVIRVGILLVDEHLANFTSFRTKNQHRKAVESYNAAQRIVQKISQYDHSIALPSSLDDAIADSRTRATTQYAEEKYQQGLTLLGKKDYREAYNFFQLVIDTLPNYKDALYRQKRSLELGMHRIAILTPSATRFSGSSRFLQTEVLTALLDRNDPFIEIIDRRHLETILKEQKLSYTGLINDKSAIEAGDISGISSIIYVEILSIDSVENHETKSVKVAHYLEPKIFDQSYTDTAGNYISQYLISFQSRPATVALFERSNTVTITANYQIISVATSHIETTKNRKDRQSSSVTYAASQNYDYRALSTFVPEAIVIRGSEQMAISRQDQLVRTYSPPYQRSYFNAPRLPTNMATLTSRSLERLGKTVSNDIYSFFNSQVTHE